MRGCGYLPHVGEHPGTFPLTIFFFIGIYAGITKGWIGWIAAIILIAIILPIYLYGSYDRAQISDYIEQNRE